MEAFLTQYGLIAVFLCALIENDITFVLAGVVCDLGIIHPAPALLAGVFGTLVHDSVWFAVGHRGSDTIRQSRLYQRFGPLIERLAQRFGPWQLAFSRLFYGTRNPSLLFWGVQRMAVPKFLALETLAVSLWGGFLLGAGYFLSDRAMVLVGKVKTIEHWLLGGLVIALLSYLFGRLFTRGAVKRVETRTHALKDRDE